MSNLDKAVFITGSSSGIGEQTAYHFAKHGWKLAITYHTKKEDGQQVADECTRLGASDVLLEKLEIADDRCIQLTVQNVLNKYGKIDILINNAGVLAQKPLGEKTFEDIETQIKVNLEGPIKLTKLCLPHVREAVVNIGSRLGTVGRKNLTVYSATKFGVRGFTKALALEYPQLRVVCVNPGLTATRMGDQAGVSARVVGELIYRVAIGEIQVSAGGDFNVFEYLENPVKRLVKKIIHQ